jgi:nucleoside-diphosphate-sugar epimerase
MRILITGASGFIGRHLTHRLLASGYHLRLLTRSRHTIEGSIAASPQVEVKEGDLTRPESLEGLLEGVEAVYHLAGILGQAQVKKEVYWALNYRASKNLLALCLRENNLQRFIYCGSAGVQGPISNPPADESRPYAPSNIYETTKAEAEKAVLACHQEHGLPVVVLRPEFVYGPGDLHVLGLFRSIAQGRFVLFGRGKSWLHPTYIDDVIQGLYLALHAEQAVGQVYIIAAERAVRVKELADRIADTLGVQRPRSIPLLFGALAALAFELAGRLSGKDLPFNRARFKYFTEDRSFDIARARRELGYRPRFDLERGIETTVAWYKQEGYL